MRGLICDDHPLMREALAASMQDRWPDVTLVECGDFPAAWTAAEAAPDFCLLDLSMPGADPLTGLTGLRSRAPAAVIVVVTGLEDEALLAQVRACGVADILSKNAEPRLILDAIRDSVPDLRDLEVKALPRRQGEVLALLAEGLTNKEIARRLDISPATVKIHVARLTQWLGAANRTDAVARAQKGRLI